ncbi:MAG: sigma-54-dependent Fis family transcriptional regulator [Myxococcales bacterium]|nr:sigma-54-dependent Fis family transcriptional regulator [Myxococcales bacterium]
MPYDNRIIALVDDDPTVLNLMNGWLEGVGHRVLRFSDARSFLDDPVQPSAICLDAGLGDVSGLEVLATLRSRNQSAPIIFMVAAQDQESAVAAMRQGAYDYLMKPLDRDRAVLAVGRALERHELARHVSQLREELSDRHVLASIVGKSPPMRELARQVRHVLDHEVTVTLLGEPGSGKELVARAIHFTGRRADGPFVAINCAAVPESLHELELFGVGRAGTELATEAGRFEMARGGTLFLDEIASMSPLTQASLLRVLREGHHPGPSSDEPRADARLVCATHRDLLGEVRAGRFREDLYFQLVVHPIRVPALRERREDIPLLVKHFLQKYQLDRSVVRVSADGMSALSEYDWPGNVRELEDVIHRALLAAQEDIIDVHHLPVHVRPVVERVLTPTDDLPGLDPDAIIPMRELERRAIRRALRATNGSVDKAAKLLGMGRATLYRRLSDYEGVTP